MKKILGRKREKPWEGKGGKDLNRERVGKILGRKGGEDLRDIQRNAASNLFLASVCFTAWRTGHASGT